MFLVSIGRIEDNVKDLEDGEYLRIGSTKEAQSDQNLLHFGDGLEWTLAFAEILHTFYSPFEYLEIT